MSALTLLAGKPVGHRPPLNPRRPFFSKSPSLKIPLRPLLHPTLSPIRAEFQNENPRNPNRPQNPFTFQTNNETSNPTPLKSTLITAVTAAAFLLSGFCFSMRPSTAVPISPPPIVETYRVSDEGNEKSLKENSSSDPVVDIDELKNLVEIKLKSRKITEAISILDKLIELEPQEIEWRLSIAHLYIHTEEFKLARKCFHELLNENPNCLEACQGLVNVDSQDESKEELKNTERRIEEAIKQCKKENNTKNLREFKLLIAQIRVLEGKFDDALRFYKELEKEEPSDFRMYLCQGLVYFMLRRNDEAEESLKKYRKLVPKGHPYASEFDENLAATTIFAHKVENERAMAKN